MNEVLPPLTNAWLDSDWSGMKSVVRQMIGTDEDWTSPLAKDSCLAKGVLDLHDGVNRRGPDNNLLPDTNKPPSIVFVTATTAIPYAFAIKECWRTAFVGENPPRFFILDVSSRRFGSRFYKFELDAEAAVIQANEDEQVRRLQRYGELYKALDNVALFDEFVFSGSSLKRADTILNQAGFRNINFLYGYWGHGRPDASIVDEIKPVIRTRGLTENGYRKLILQVNDESKEVVADMKSVGKAMGEEIIRRRILASERKP